MADTERAALAAQAAQPTEKTVRQFETLLEVSESIAHHRDLGALFHDLAGRLHRVVQFDYLSLVLHDPEANVMRLHILETAHPHQIQTGTELPLGETPSGLVFETQQPYFSSDITQETRFPAFVERLSTESISAVAMLPLTTAQRRIGVLGFGRQVSHSYAVDEIEFMQRVACQVAVAVDNALAFKEIAELKNKLADEKLYLEDEIRSELNFEEIIGESGSLKQILKQAETVAPTDSTVLILGETGTGKELIARAIHNLSQRRERTFVKINCAAIPTGLLESELFGHERGAFTGAIAQKLGRFELADKGTLFLDEVGDIPLELQPKLLRVLQEQEFERLGGTRSIHVDVRLVAATNHDLSALVKEGRFRSDLYYRFNVFPLRMPPLRKRSEDIPLLVRYFVQKYSRRMNKPIESISTESLEALARYQWPGNIRELENLVERAVIVSSGAVLRIPVGELRASPDTEATAGAGPASVTMEEAEREAILRALGETNWMLGGPRGAAARLGMKRTTLQSRMVKLGIKRRS